MSPTRSGYRELGLELVSLEENCSRTPKKPSMVGENKDDGTGDPFKMLLEEALERQRNEMMETLHKSFDDCRQVTHPPQVEAPPPSRYKSILIFLYLKVK
jgi:hypothetical protein